MEAVAWIHQEVLIWNCHSYKKIDLTLLVKGGGEGLSSLNGSTQQHQHTLSVGISVPRVSFTVYLI